MQNSNSTANDQRLGPPRPVLLLMVIALGVLACATGIGPQRGEVKRQSWWSDRGPVVPHDSFPADCGLCHQGEGWNTLVDDFTFDHGAMTGLVLAGLHDEAECLRCHNDRGPVELYAQRGCAGCHEDVHRGQLGSDCAACHSDETLRWGLHPDIAQHDQTRFPLLGTHAAVSCWRCHSGAEVGDFVGASVECLDCHGDDLARALDPDHIALGLMDSCERCHATTAWEAGRFQHTGIVDNCVECHLEDFVATTSPDHADVGFPMSCEDCHRTNTWFGADFDHDFPITSGDHRNLDCTDCHTVRTDYSMFSCIDCHAHTKSDMDDEHDDVRDYSYDSPSCYACHPDGKD